jgi:hypothetical protein
MNIQILLAELDRRIKFHFENQEDPHNIGNCCGVVLHEMRDAIIAACGNPLPMPSSSLVDAYANIIAIDLMTTTDGWRAKQLVFEGEGLNGRRIWFDEDNLKNKIREHLYEFERRLEERARDLKGK